LRLALLYGAIFLVFGVQQPFLPVWLGARGLPVNEIALILALPKVLQVLMVPPLSRLADRRGDVVTMLVASSIAMTVLFVALAAPAGPAITLIVVSLLFLAESGSFPLLDVLAFGIFASGRAAPELTEGKPFDYGRIRKWGSLAFIAGNLAAGAFLTLTSLTAVTLMLAVASAAAAVVLFYAWPLDRLLQPAKGRAGQAEGRAGSRFLPLVIAAAACIQASHALAMSFAPVHWAETGHSDAFIGAAWAIGVAVETLVFALFGRWIAGADQAAGMLIVGGLAAAARWMVMACDPSDVVLLIVQASHGLSFAATHAGTMLLIADMAHADRRATAQGWATAAIAGLTAALTAASGPLIVRFGQHAYVGMAGFALVGALLAVSVSSLRARERQAATVPESA